MKIEGLLVEIGDLDGGATPGIRIERGDDTIELSGVTVDEIRALPNLLFKRVSITLELAT